MWFDRDNEVLQFVNLEILNKKVLAIYMYTCISKFQCENNETGNINFDRYV